MTTRLVWTSVTGMAFAAVRSLLITLGLMLLYGLLLAAASYWHLQHGLAESERASASQFLPALMAVLVFVECVVIAAVLGVQRAISGALLHAVRKHQFGRTAVGLLFDRILRVRAEGASDEPKGTAARVAERLPLAEVEGRLASAVRGLLHADEARASWLRRKLQGRLLRLVEMWTLARFRQADARQAGIDLAAVRAELEPAADDWLIHKIRGSVGLWTVLVVVLLPLQVVVVDYLLLRAF